ncbi:hypothetical protein [Roseobacter sinensis]|uniref:Carboxypeptidase regulatory-like domain-containing protein n=1 Tax=Roseobacter sinensis TaxID=2931391 RepID=A0ABT3BER9_9RHOB|nr:hypothetical protein [Roseobacter sp. WL0113]MCV3272074.1 hypothetical protein [Roseobacter sp. WL0113]
MPRPTTYLSFVLVFALFGWCSPPALAADQLADQTPLAQPAGLMWNRTGLPAVFPLQVKSRAGRDYVLTLIDNETGAEALAAYIEGGAFFNVLVPPGVYRVRFAAGRVWQDERELFGPGALTEHFELEAPLTFEIRNPGIKAGHIIDLSTAAPGQMAQAQTSERLLCQTVRSEDLRLPVGNEIELVFPSVETQRLIVSWRGQLRFPERRTKEVFRPPTHFEYRNLKRHRAVRSRLCG